MTVMISLPWRRKDPTDPVVRVAELSVQLEESRGDRDRIGRGLLEMLECVKDLSLDLAEIGSVELKRSLDELARLVQTAERGGGLDEALTRRRAEVVAYSARVRAYLDEREAELKRIVELLSRELSAFGDDNETYHQKIIERGARLETVSQLGDIRRMRQELQSEVAVLRETVRKKQREDARRMESLQHEVDALRTDVQRARNEALTDGLTGAWNRAAFDQQLDHVLHKNSVTPTACALLLIDVDHFKAINDTHGHPVGDRVLMALVLACREQIRRDDFLARYGGEEFAVILPSASSRNGLAKARQLCKSQATRQYAVEKAGSISFTISIGVTALHEGDTRETLLARVDEALYEAKHKGRNRAVLRK